MQKVKIEPFKVIGITVNTTNANGQSADDISQLWGKFMAERTAEKIPNKIDDNIFSVYTNYEGDHSHAYDTILGCKVSSLDDIPEGMVGHAFDGGSYGKFIAKGDLTKGVVFGAWMNINQQKLDRVYTADFELYGEKAQNPTNGEVEIYVGI